MIHLVKCKQVCLGENNLKHRYLMQGRNLVTFSIIPFQNVIVDSKLDMSLQCNMVAKQNYIKCELHTESHHIMKQRLYRSFLRVSDMSAHGILPSVLDTSLTIKDMKNWMEFRKESQMIRALRNWLLREIKRPKYVSIVHIGWATVKEVCGAAAGGIY